MSNVQTVEKRMRWSDWRLVVQYALGKSDDEELQGLMGRLWPARLQPDQRRDPEFIYFRMTASDACHLNLVAQSLSETFADKALPSSLRDMGAAMIAEEMLQSGEYDEWKQFPGALEILARRARIGVPLEKDDLEAFESMVPDH